MNPIARLGQNEAFVAFMAHCWFAFAFVYVPVAKWHLSLGIFVLAGVIGAGIKEFAFDARYETNPPQTFEDDLTDFTGYCVGILLAIIVLLL
ncbi:MAG: hypothetical protein KGI71_05205 [Patescibacteria group bacterium]|nr:hypothetical protein [Patescibacteria group bacterium]